MGKQEKVVVSHRPGPVTRLTIPAHAAYDLDKLKKVVGSLAERLGCARCLSGTACVFDLERHVVVRDDLSLEAVAGDPDPMPWIEAISDGLDVIVIG